MNELKSIVIIPARFDSSRFPGKPLASIAQKPMIRHVYERVLQAKRVSEVVVATDDPRILEAVTAFGGKARMTSRKHLTGTDRVAEVARDTDAQIVVNAQGDEPLIDPGCIDAAIEPFYSNPQLMISTLKSSGRSEDELYSPNVVKVVTDHQGYALYFSRSPLPYFRYASNSVEKKNQGFFKHIGLYAYRRHFLDLLPGLKPSTLEKAEGLEQLRFLENGFKIKVVEYDYQTLAVDTPEDLVRVNEFLSTNS
jgi:3-deoxy-manno-octulosonate cytidylyltransferase (CMP-KDO synthetase)